MIIWLRSTSERNIDRNKYLEPLYEINLVELYRPYVKVEDNKEE